MFFLIPYCSPSPGLSRVWGGEISYPYLNSGTLPVIQLKAVCLYSPLLPALGITDPIELVWVHQAKIEAVQGSEFQSKSKSPSESWHASSPSFSVAG